jgi:hypothetical protein
MTKNCGKKFITNINIHKLYITAIIIILLIRIKILMNITILSSKPKNIRFSMMPLFNSAQDVVTKTKINILKNYLLGFSDISYC